MSGYSKIAERKVTLLVFDTKYRHHTFEFSFEAYSGFKQWETGSGVDVFRADFSDTRKCHLSASSFLSRTLVKADSVGLSENADLVAPQKFSMSRLKALASEQDQALLESIPEFGSNFSDLKELMANLSSELIGRQGTGFLTALGLLESGKCSNQKGNISSYKKNWNKYAKNVVEPKITDLITLMLCNEFEQNFSYEDPNFGRVTAFRAWCPDVIEYRGQMTSMLVRQIYRYVTGNDLSSKSLKALVPLFDYEDHGADLQNTIAQEILDEMAEEFDFCADEMSHLVAIISSKQEAYVSLLTEFDKRCSIYNRFLSKLHASDVSGKSTISFISNEKLNFPPESVEELQDFIDYVDSLEGHSILPSPEFERGIYNINPLTIIMMRKYQILPELKFLSEYQEIEEYFSKLIEKRKLATTIQAKVKRHLRKFTGNDSANLTRLDSIESKMASTLKPVQFLLSRYDHRKEGLERLDAELDQISRPGAVRELPFGYDPVKDPPFGGGLGGGRL